MSSTSSLGTYTPQQIKDYLKLIAVPITEHAELDTSYVLPDMKNIHAEDALEYLNKLQVHHLATIPFENLSLHYSSHRKISVDKDYLFEKIVSAKNGRGGYCMEVNALFATVLNSLGFDVIAVGARVYSDGEYSPW